MREICGGNVAKIVLFCSYATGKFQPDSDLDICLALDELPRTKEEVIRLRNIDDELDVGRDVDVVICNTEKYKTGGLVFDYIRRDGVIIYERI